MDRIEILMLDCRRKNVSMIEHKIRPRLIYMDVVGRLGNQLIISAHLMAFAKKNHCHLLNLGLTRYAGFFNGSRNSLVFCSYPPHSRTITYVLGPRLVWGCRRYFSRLLVRIFKKLYRWHLIPDSWIIDFGDDHSLIPDNLARLQCRILESRCFLFMMGWSFRDVESVKEFASEIKEYFKTNNPYLSNVRDYENTLRVHKKILVGIHLRRGDYQKWQGGKFFYPLELYARVISCLQQQLIENNPQFVVVSDSMDDATKLSELCSELGVVTRSGVDIEDMYFLSRCDYLVGPPSTFSKCASFLGDKPVLVLDRPDTDCSLDLVQVFSDLRP
jgi:hypothetical protein